MAQTIYYSTSKAINKIAERSLIYNKEKRDSDAYLWLYKKMAYAEAYATGAPGLKTHTGGFKGSDSMYEQPGIVKNEEQEDIKTRFLPKAHLVSLKTSFAGDMGSTIKCEIAFTVYSLDQLVTHEGFFKIGADMSANWGWANAGDAGSSESFTGKVVNFSWSVNADGGADCTCTGIGRGIDILGANAKLPTAAAITAKVLGTEVKNTSVISTITLQAVTAAETIALSVVDPATGLGCVEYADDWASSETRNKPVAKKGPFEKIVSKIINGSVDPKRIYVTLKRVIELYNLALTKASTDNPKPILICNEEVTKGHIPEAPFASANPTECIFPGRATYGEKIFDFDNSTAFTGGDLSQIMINTNWLAKAFESVGKTTAKKDKSPDLSVSAFLKIIFAMIEKNSGGAFKLTAAADPEKGQSYKINIIEAQYIGNEVDVTNIPAVTQNSTARSISVSAKIPADLANAAANAGNSGSCVINSAALVKFSPVSKIAEPPISYDDLTKALASVGNEGTSAENVSAVQTALKAVFKAKSNVSVMYPIDFSFTVDGLSGFIFGNAVKTNYLPGKYRGDKCVFTVTTVEHNVSGNDWTTTCNTVFRLRPD